MKDPIIYTKPSALLRDLMNYYAETRETSPGELWQQSRHHDHAHYWMLQTEGKMAGWSRGSWQTDGHTCPVSACDPAAVCFCMDGGINQFACHSGEIVCSQAKNAVKGQLPARENGFGRYRDIPDWNDYYKRTLDEIIAVGTAAADALEAQGQ